MFYYLLICVCILYLIYRITNKYSWDDMPPGPKGLPVFGNLIDLLLEEPALYYAKLSQKYGPILSIHLGRRRIVLLSSASLVRKAFVGQGNVFTGRPKGILLSYISGGKGIAMSTEERNFYARKTLMGSFKHFGFGKNNFESYIDIELGLYLEALKNNQMKCYNPHFDLARSTLNITWHMLSGEKFNHNDPKLEGFVKNIGMSFELVKYGNFLSFTYILQFIFTFLRPKAMQVGWSVFQRFRLFYKTLKNHHNTINDASRGNDFMYDFISQQKRYTNQKEMKEIFSDSQLCWILSDVFIAAIETTVTNIRWALTMSVQHPNVQTRIHEEIEEVLGKTRPTVSDIDRMPYIEAFISEVLRMYPPLPMLIHSTLNDTKLENYHIRKDTWVLVNILGINMDPKIWGDPEVFRPSRFLNQEGKYEKSEHLIPFSVGRRNCIGEPLAKAEVFLFLSSIFQNYFVSKYDETKPWNTNIKYGLTLTPHDLHFKFIPKEIEKQHNENS